jgi:hypothetical protein
LIERRARVLLTPFVLLAFTLIGCNTGGSASDLEGTVVARVVATLESAAPTATPAPPEPTTTSVDLESTIVARVVATLARAETTPAPSQTPPAPTATATPSGPTVTPPAVIEAEEYAVYSALIQQNPIGYDLGASILIREQTISDLEMLDSALERASPLPAGLVDSYRSRNAASYTLDPNLDVDLEYALMPEDEFTRIFLRRGSVWTRFQEAYPEAEGIVFFSRVGFGANGDDALVTMGYRCGDLCGAGGLYLLAREDGGWQVQDALIIWQS